MADNIAITAGTGTTVAADDISGVMYQRVKIGVGADGSATDVSAAAPIPAKLSDGTNAVAVKAASTAPVVGDAALVVSISPNSVNANGRAAAATSAPVVLATEDFAAVGALTETAPTTDTASSGLNGRLQRLAQNITSLIALSYGYLAKNSPTRGCISTAMTATTSTSLLAAPGASLFNYITQITVSNSHATVGTDLELQDGSGGTTFYVIPAAAVYGGAAISFPSPLKQPTANTALYVKNTTTGASTRVSASGYTGA